MTGQKVGVEVRECDILDLVPRFRGICQVLFDVALRVDDDRLFRPVICDQIGRMSETAEVILLEKHV